MESVVVRFSGTADFAGVNKQLAVLQAQFEALGKTMQTAMKSQFPNGSATYNQQLKQVGQMRTAFNDLAMSSGAYSVESVKAVSATQALSKSIADQKLTLSSALRNLKNFQSGWREQAALQKSSIMQWTNSTTGKNNVDLYMPKEGSAALDSFRTKYGYINQAIGSIATQTINWGKNTQWAGRQITVGIGVPIAMAFGLMSKAAMTADADLTRIAKVYNTTTDSLLTGDQQQIVTQNQLKDVRKNAMTDAITMAKQYGQSMDDTLQIEADLAAIGKTGNELRSSTAQVTRVATLGELDHNTAMQMSISLMNAYKLTGDKLGDAFNYINDIENTTSLTTKDFAEAIPRAAAAMASMGVSVQQTGVLLVAMKQGGVDATEGMNALKSATTRLLKPTADAQNRFNALGINIQNVTREAGGNLFTILEKLGPAMAGVDPVVRQAALSALFGTYQFNKLNVALDGVTSAYSNMQKNIVDPNNQVQQAMMVAAQDPSQWAAVANQEQAQLQQSISFQWKSTIAQIKTQLATLGQSVITALLPIGKAVLSVIQWFNGWGDTSKKIALWIAGLLMLSGPLIMLLGLFGNLAGNAAKFASVLSNLVLKFKIVDPEQRASALMAKQAASAFDSEAGSIARLNMEMQNLVKTQLAMAAQGGVQVQGLTGASLLAAQQVGAAPTTNAKASASGAPLPVMMANGRYQHPTTGKFMSNQEVADMKKAALEADAIAGSAEKTSVSFGKILGKLGMFGVAAYSLKSMVDSSGGFVSNLLSASLFVGMMAGSGGFKAIGKAITGIPGLFKSAWGGITTLFGRGLAGLTVLWRTAGGSWTKVLSGLGGSLASFFTGPLGIITLIAGTVAVWVSIEHHMQAATRQQKALNDSTSDWAKVLGYADKSFSNMNNAGTSKDGNTPTAWQARAEQVKKLNSEMVDGLKNAYDGGKGLTKVYNMAVDEAFKVKLSGGSAAQAKRAFEIALQAAGVTTQEFDTLDVKFNNVNVDDTAAIQKHVQDNLKNAFRDLGNYGDMAPSDFRPWADLSNSASAAASKIGGAFTEGLQAANNLGDVKTTVKTFTDNMNKSFSTEFDKIAPKNKATLKKYGITNAQQYEKAYETAWTDASKGVKFETPMDKAMLAINTGDDHASNVGDLMRKVYGAALSDVKDKLHLTDSQMKALEATGYDTDAMVKLLGQDMLGLGTSGQVGAAQAAAAMNNLGGAVSDYRYNATQTTAALQNTMKGWMSDIYAQADNIMGEQYQAQIDGINKAGQARQKAFDAKGKALDKSQKAESDALKKSQDDRSQAFDDQIKQTQDAAQAQEDAIQAQIDAETKQDDIRQKLFDREKTRIERLAQMQNDSIDFNAALNSGNMDSAAKLYNSHAATVQGYQIDDQNTKASADLKATTDGQTAQIKAIKDATDAQVAILQGKKDALKDVFDYENNLLQEKQQNEKDALDAAKQADQDRTASAAANAQKRQALNKLELDQEVMAIKAQTPRTQAEAQAQVDALQVVYKKYGVNLNANAEEWSQYIANDLTAQVGTAAAALQNDIDWQTEGNNITTLLGAGAGLSTDQLKSFLATGKWPASAAPPQINPATGYYVGPDGKVHKGAVAKHSGGFSAPNGKLSWTQKERMGVPAGAGVYPSEIPTLLKHGEFVVNDKATAANLPLLNHINAGGSIEGLMGAHHLGGAALFGAVARDIPNSFGAATYLALSQRMADAMNARLATQYAAPSSSIAGDIAASAIGGADQNGQTWKALDAIRRQLFPTSALTSGYRPGATGPTGKKDYHNMGMAIDIGVNGNAQSGLMPIAATLAKIFPGSTELIHNPNGSIKNGQNVPASFWGPSTWAEHASHVHWAMTPADLAKAKASAKFDQGGFLQDGMLGVNHSGKPEPVFTAGQWDLLSSLITNSANVLHVAQNNGGSLATGTKNEYNLTVDLRGAYIKEDVNIKKAVEDAIYEINNKSGLNRKVGDSS